MFFGAVSHLKRAIAERRFVPGSSSHTYGYVGEGDRAVYCVNKRVVGKECESKELAYKEYSLGKFLYGNGIYVPKMKRVVGIWTGFDFAPIKEWFLLMERVHGKHIENLTGEEREEALRQVKSGVEKILDLGIYPEDFDWGMNLIFDGKRVCFIDFEKWGYGCQEELAHLCKKIRNEGLVIRV